jgi:Na+(H+)/acetate symporter ActP
MLLQSVDWIIIAAFFVILLTIGYLASKNASRSAADFFVSGRSMPWWLLGVSMVATTFSCDTPNLVTDMVRQNGCCQLDVVGISAHRNAYRIYICQIVEQVKSSD